MSSHKYLAPPNEFHRRAVLAELNATEESVRNDVQNLMRWMEMQPHLPNVKDETLLCHFLLLCKNRLEETKKQLEIYYVIKAKMNNFFSHQDPCLPEYRQSMNVIAWIPMPKLTVEGHRIVVIRFFAHTAADVPTAYTYVRLCEMLFDAEYTVAVPQRTILIFDFQNSSPAVIQMLLSILKYVRVLQKIRRARIRAIYLLNMTSKVEVIFKAFKLVLQGKLIARMVGWKKDTNALTEILPKECLPFEYGGDLPSIEQLRDNAYKYLCSRKDWYRAQESMKADLTKLPADYQTHISEIPTEALDGSFRQLSFD